MTLDDTAHSPLMELVAGASLVHQQALDRLQVPALIVDLATRTVLAANRSFAELFEVTLPEILRQPATAIVGFEDPGAIDRSVEALFNGDIDGYRARRRFTTRSGASKEVQSWCRAVDIDGVRHAVWIISPIRESEDGVRPVEPPVAWSGPLVAGKTDAQWVIACISSDIRDVIGREPDAVVGRSLLNCVHPDDGGDLRRAVDESTTSTMTARMVRLHHRDGHSVPATCLFLRVEDVRPSPLGFALLPQAPPHPAPDRVSDLEQHLHRIAAELRAAGVIDDVRPLPTVGEFPQLSGLSSRQWQILARLLRGERVPGIARALYLSPGTVRNHLSVVFERFGVHSQAELIALLNAR